MLSVIQFVLALLVGKAVVQASNVLNIEGDLDHWVGKDKAALVEFWAPWCDHCQQLEPVYEELADVFAHLKDKIVIAKMNVDGSHAQPLLEKHGINGLPTIKWFGLNGETDDYDPEASRTLEDLIDFVEKKSGLMPKLPHSPLPPPTVTTKLTPDNFYRIVNDPSKDVLVAFTATWCDHCQKLKPIYDLVAWYFRSEKHVVIANLDADADVDRALAKKYRIEGYPILKLFPKGRSEKVHIDYRAARNERSLVEFLNEHTGTQRAVGGGLNEKAGRVEKLDDMVKPFVIARPSQRREIYEVAKQVALGAGTSAKHYLRIMDKLAGGNDTFLTQEKTRLLGLLKKHSLTEDKLDEIKIRYNILSTFVLYGAAQKVAETAHIERVQRESAREGAESALDNVSGALETEAKRNKDEL